MRSAKPKLSAIIACYRDAPAIPQMYARLKGVFAKIGVGHEIIFVNDSSPDDSEAVLAALAHKDRRVVVVTHSRNFGSQGAFTSGMMIATGDAVVLLDGDLQDPPELIEDFYREWRKGYQVVYGVRVKRQASRSMQIAYKMFYRIFRSLSYINVPADAGDFSLIDRRVVDVLNDLPENNRFLRGLRAWAGFRQTGVPYERPERMFGQTTNSLLKNIGWAQRAIFSFSYAPLNLISWLAVLVVAISFLAIAVQILVRLFLPGSVPSGFTTLIVLILFMGGIQLLGLAILGTYIAHIYDEVKRRPSFVVREILNDPRSRRKTNRPSRA